MTTRALKCLTALVITASLTAAVPAGAALPDRRLPPSTRDELAQIFDSKVRDLGFRTTRALLQNLDTYAADPEGRHFAIYLEPIDEELADAEYVARFTAVAKVFLPLVFKRWKGLKSFDVCLEPVTAEDDGPAPPPITQLLVTRRGSRAIDWNDVTLADLLVAADEFRATETADADVYVYFEERLAEVPELSEAREASTAR